MNVKLILGGVLVIALIILVLTQAFPGFTNHGANNITVGFEDYGVYVPLNRTIYTASPYVPYMYWANGTTKVGNVTFNSTHVMLGANETNNATDPATYYAYYTYYDKPWVGGADYTYVVVLAMLVVGVAVILKASNYL